MKTIKKLLSAVLVLVMLLTAMPMAFAEGSDYKVGDIIQFGSYPQSEVNDQALLFELNKLAPAWENWTSYDYYWGLGDGLKMQHDWMKYTDVEYGGNKYRGVKFLEYRPQATNDLIASTWQDDNGYLDNITYWFKFEPIDWRVLDPETGFVMCELLIDAQPYSNSMYDNGDGTAYRFFNDLDYKNYANDYETSFIRKWLNEDFYNTAFSNNEKKEISITTLNNDSRSDAELNSNATNDKIFLLSDEEVCNSDFGFTDHSIRMAKSSAYAKCQGLAVTYDTGSSLDYGSNWLLRTPDDFSAQSVIVLDSGDIDWFWVDNVSQGIRPAFKFNDINNFGCKHDYKIKVYAPTCTDKGYTTYICECGDSYIDNYVNAKGHIDNNGDYKCDYGCGYEFEKPAKEPNFFQKIIEFFRNLFDKLFGFFK